mgnify:FL=1
MKWLDLLDLLDKDCILTIVDICSSAFCNLLIMTMVLCTHAILYRSIIPDKYDDILDKHDNLSVILKYSMIGVITCVHALMFT